MRRRCNGTIAGSLVVALACTLGTACVIERGEGESEGEGEGEAGSLRWYETCGDPSCAGFVAPTGTAACDTEVAGAACASADAECYLVGDGCNVHLRCTDSDPTMQPGGCPISVPSAKQDVRFLSDAEIDAALGRVLSLQLARWQYVSDPGRHDYLGFLIDEHAPDDAVLPRGDRVDLYGYTSLAIAAVQAQQRRIDTLERELAALRATDDADAATCALP
ncbi:MAG: hypothetical protein IT383_07710 [Deltaproteobacteria bacterium]|nr:hypothetical protein [Deltaproteobacteria bacterium]